MNTTPTRARPLVVYRPSVVLSLPIVADRDVIDQLYDYAQTASGLSLSTAARQLGITPPSSRHRWAVGWSAPTDPELPSRLVWYDPDKLASIDATVRRIAAEHPEVDEVTVVQGTGWDDWAVTVAGPPRHGDGAAATWTEPPPAAAAGDRGEACEP